MMFKTTEDMFRLLVENVNDGISVSQDWVFKYANPQLANMLELPQTEIAKRPFLEFIHPEDRALVKDRYSRRLAGGNPPSVYEFRILSASGKVKTVQISAILFEWEERPATLDVFTDISHRKAFQRQLADSEHRYRSVFEHTGTATVIIENDTTISMANSRFEKLSGFTAEEIADGKVRWVDLVAYRQDLDRMLRYHRGRRENPENIPSSYETTFETRTGELKNILINVGMIPGSDRSVASFTDITALRRTEKELRKNEALHRAFFGSLSAGIVLADPASARYTEFNDHWLAMTGYTSDEMKQLTPLEMTHPEDIPDYLACRRKLLSGETSQCQAERRFVRKDGTHFWASISVSCIRGEEGAPTGILLVVIDIDEQKRLERQFHRVQKMEALGTLAGGVAHDFNNILMPISGYAELLRHDHRDNPETLKKLDHILAAADRASKMVRQILTFSRQDEDNPKVVGRFDQIAKEALQLLRASIPKTIEMQQKIENVGYIDANPTQIHQIVMNLCTNAYHAMESTGGVMQVSLERRHCDPGGNARPAEGYARLSVKDQGVGIPEEIRERIFDPFFTTKKRGAGTGMGLSVVHGIVESHGGHIEVESTVGAGAEFSVYLPISDALERKGQEKRPQKEALPRGCERLLVVDDETAIVHILKSHLSRLGYHVAAFDDSLAALADFKRNSDRYDLLISDITMPKMSGFELAENILAIRPELPVILQSGYSSPGPWATHDRVKKLGIKKLFAKPVLVEEYAVEIRKILDERAAVN